MIENYLNDLNESQKEAVINTEGPSLVIAGAGSGKTRVLTYRIVHILQKGIPARQILALTFTNKAAKEMKERITKIVGPEISRYLWMGTFHSIFSKILRMEATRLGYKPNFTIYDSSDSKSLIRTILKEQNLDDNVYKPGVIASRISYAKNHLITANRYMAEISLHEDDKANKMPQLAEIYKIYSGRCFRANAMDFDDLLLNTNVLFRDFPDTLKHYQDKFKYILVDEYQDTNYAQYLIVKKLAATHHNICVVGDDAQSIYSFRGARIENILEFERDYPEYHLFKLEQNYRSTQTIVEAANKIIANNDNQIDKKVFSENESGEKIRVFQFEDNIKEAVNIISDIFDKRFSLHLLWSDFAILYRTNVQSRMLEEALRNKNIPYKIYGGLSFYDRAEIKDIISYFRMVINPEDEEALKRSIKVPKRGIGDTTLEKLGQISSSENIPIWLIINDVAKLSKYFNQGTITKLNGFVEVINHFRKNADSVAAFTKAKQIAVDSGIMKELRASKAPEDISRFENMEELLNGIKIFTETAETNGDPSNLEAYMATVSLLTDQDSNKEDKDTVTLMTMHSAKGLEFKHVYVVGMEDTLFPSPMSSGSARELEEERRLFYVAVTRAEKELTLSYARYRHQWGNIVISNPSRFLNEIDKKFLHFPQTGGKPFPKTTPSGGMPVSAEEKPAYHNNNVQPASTARLRPVQKAVLSTPAPSTGNFVASDPSEFSEGDTVQHERFGTGKIISIEGKAPNTTATVQFDKEGNKKLLLRFAKLKKV
jgi:DNA helicase-2/ATP-dependent DNA helicase PcrA